MPKRAPSAAELFSTIKNKQLPVLGEALARGLGPPPGAKRMSDAALVEKWWQVDPALVPNPSPATLYDAAARLREQGASPDDVTRAIYPWREDTYSLGVIGIENQKKEADRLAKLAMKSPPSWYGPPPEPVPEPADAAPLPSPEATAEVSTDAPAPPAAATPEPPMEGY